MPKVDSVLREIGKWKFMVITDLLKSFYQIPLANSSMKYCGVATPFKGIRVYTRSAMGMPGSETCLEELMSRVLGDLIQEGCVAKIADDLYVGGNSPIEVLANWRRVPALLQKNNLRLSAAKTIICPRKATVLGWVWFNGNLQASPHKLAALSSVEPPSTVQGSALLSKPTRFQAVCFQNSRSCLIPWSKPLQEKNPEKKIAWCDELLLTFKTAQSTLADNRTITIPQPQDALWKVTDGSVKNRGIAATLYVHRNGSLLLAGFFSAKLCKHQVTWLPFEIEALAIGAAIRHFAPYIIQSPHTAEVLIDNRPCVQAYEKLKRGEFSASSRVTTFLSAVSRYSVHIHHIAGVENLPSDYASQNTKECLDSSYQICKFIVELEVSVVRSLSVIDVLQGSVKMPFASRAAWQATQLDLTSGEHTLTSAKVPVPLRKPLKLLI